MSLTTNKSAISEVRDQLSLDFADDEHLDTIGQNLGIHKRLFSFDDSIWRALIKTLAIEYKQVVTKFADVLAILFGPAITEVGTIIPTWDESVNPKQLIATVAVGDTSFIMNDASDLPQVGTLIFDEGLSTEETLPYIYIDRHTNEVVLLDKFLFSHIGSVLDAEELVLAISSSGEIVCSSTESFPYDTLETPSPFPYPVVLDRGLSTEAVYTVTANDTSARTLTTSGAPYGLHSELYPSNVSEDIAQKYFPSSNFIVLEDSKKFPPSGVIRVDTKQQYSVENASANTSDKTLEVFASFGFAAGDLHGYELVFDGNITPGLAGVKRRVVSNTATTIELDEDFVGPGDFPAANELFTLYPIIKYTSNDYEQNTLNLYTDMPVTLQVLDTDSVELLDDAAKVSLSSVKFAGSGWDIVQSTPRLVELYIPESIRGVNTPRSASYIHDDTIDPTNLPLTIVLAGNPVSAGDTEVLISASTAFPTTGVVVLDKDQVDEEIVSYGMVVSSLKADAIATATTLLLVDTNSFPTIGNIVIGQGLPSEEVLSILSNNKEIGELTTTVLVNAHYDGEIVKSTGTLLLQSPAVNVHAGLSFVEYYSPTYSGGLIRGDFYNILGTYPGPYVYSIFEDAPSPPPSTGTLLDWGNYNYDSSNTFGATTEVRFDESVLTTPPTRCRLANVNLALQDNSVEINNLQIGDWVQLDDEVNDEQMLFQVAAVVTPGGVYAGFDITAPIYINGFESPQIQDGTPVRVTSWSGPSVNGLSIVAPGPTPLAMEQIAGRSCLEVRSALAILKGLETKIPFSITLGREILEVSHISLASRVSSTIATVNAVAGDTIIELTALNIGFADGVGFPAGSGYRIVLSEGEVEVEVAYVLSSLSGDRLQLESSLTQTHVIGRSVALMADVLTVGSLVLNHIGATSYTERSTALQGTQFLAVRPGVFYYDTLVNVVPILDCINVADTTGLDVNGGTVLVNFGDAAVVTKNTLAVAIVAGVPTTLTLVDASAFPSTFPYEITIEKDQRAEETLLVTGKTANVLDFDIYTVRYDHPVGAVVMYEPGTPESILYFDIDVNELCFNPTAMLKYTHYPVETVIKSSAKSVPSDDGFSYPLRMPFDLTARLSYVLDLIRAAGVQVEIISNR